MEDRNGPQRRVGTAVQFSLRQHAMLTRSPIESATKNCDSLSAVDRFNVTFRYNSAVLNVTTTRWYLEIWINKREQ